MVETITPVVYGGRGRWATALASHTFGATLTAAAFGALLGWSGGALGAPFGRAGLLALAAAALVYAIGAIGLARVPVPALRRQVPDWWRTFFPPMLTAFLYGAGLGIGFLTFLATGALVVVGLAAFVSGSAAAGAAIVGAFGLARGLSAATAIRVRTVEDGAALVDRLAARSERARRVAATGSLVLVAIASLGSTSAGGSGAAQLAGATLAITFLWAAAAKLAVPARWRRALVMHELPGWVQRRAVLGVPIAEAIVPALALAGYPRASAWWAASLLVVFAAAVVRRRARSGGGVACGCFGGRAEHPAWFLLVRIAGLGVLATIAIRGPAGRPVLTLPGFPGPGDVLPAALAILALGTAALLASQAGRWLGART